MKGYRKIRFLLLGLSLLFSACPGLEKPRSNVEFYTLEYGVPQISKASPLDLVIKMERFSVAPTYNTSRIIYRDGSFKRNAYFYHKWRSNPGDLATYFLGRDMKESGLFRAVLPYGSRFPSTYRLEGTVDEFFEWDREGIWEAVLSLSIVFMAEHEPDIGKKILFQKSYRAQEPCQQRNPKALAEAMSYAMAKVSGEIIKDVYDYLSNNHGHERR